MKDLKIILRIGGKIDKSLDQALGSSAKKIKRGLGTASLAAQAVMGYGIKSAASFQTHMANVDTLLDNHKHLAGYKKAVESTANATGISLNKAADGLYETISTLGDHGKRTQKIFKTIAIAAKTGGTSVSDSADMIATAMNGYGKSSNAAAQKVSDLAFKTVKLGKTTFPELAHSMASLFPLGHTLGVSYEELFATMATATTSFAGNTAEASTQIKGLLTAFIKPSKAMQEFYDKHHTTGAELIKQKGLAGAIKMVQKEAGKDGLKDYFKNVRGLTAALGLSGKGMTKYEKYLKEMKHSHGATYDAMQQKSKSAAAKMKVAMNSLKIAATELAEPLLTAFTPIAMKLAVMAQKFTSGFQKLPKGVRVAITGVVSAIALLLPAMVVFNKVHKAFTDFQTILKGSQLIGAARGLVTKLGAVFAANPIVAQIVIIGAAIALLTILIYKNRKKIAASWGKVKKGLGELGANTKKDLAAMGKHIAHWAAGWKTNAGKIKKSMANVKKGLSTLGANTKAGLSSMKKRVVAWAAGWKTNAVKVKKSMANVRKGTAQLKKNAVRDISAMVAKGKAKFNSFRASAAGLGSYLKGTFLKKWSSVWHAASSHFASAWNGMKSAAKSAMNWIIGKINGFIQSVNSIHVPNSKLVPKSLRGAGIHISTIPYLAKGTANWPGGPAVINERAIGGEIVDLPSGTRVIPHDLSKQVIRNQSNSSATVTYAPVYNLYGSATTEDIRKADQMSQKDFERMLKKYQHDKKARSFRKVVFE